MDAADIGCSLAEAAETPLYNQYLAQAAQTGAPAMHVVYINTSLKTKAQAHAVVPTITCTSSNVVQTVLQVRCCNLAEQLLCGMAVCVFWECTDCRSSTDCQACEGTPLIVSRCADCSLSKLVVERCEV